MSHTPENKQLEKLLSNIQAKPSSRLDDKLADAPWNESDSNTQVKKNITFPESRTQKQVWRVASIIAALMIGVILFTTPVGTLAQQALSWFFSPADSNQRTDSIIHVEATPTMPPAAIQATITALQPMMSEIRRMADFDFVVPQYIPASYELDDAYTRPNLVVLVYEVRGADALNRHITLQMSYGEPHGRIEIGKDALVEQVTVDDKVIEYLQGAWITVSNNEAEDGAITIESEWNDAVQMHRLTWYDDARGIQYNMMYQGAYIPHPAYYGDGAPNLAGYLTRNDLIAIAASVP